MHRVPPNPAKASGWRALYLAAIEETDRRAIPDRVTRAEAAILARARDLFYDSGTLEEKGDLEDALYLLRALRAACEHQNAA